MTGPPAERGRRLEFLATAQDRGRAGVGSRQVVLDSAWTADPAVRSMESVRPAFNRAVEQHALFAEALEVVDAWARDGDAADRLVIEGVSYWFRAREAMWHWVHERLLWRYTLQAIEGDEPFDHVRVPAAESALVDVLRASGRQVELVEPPPPAAASADRGPRLRRLVRMLRRRLRPDRPRASGTGAPGGGSRGVAAMLGARIDGLLERAEPLVIVLTLPSSYQRLGGAAGGVRRDPNLGSVIASLREAGLAPLVVGWNAAAGDPADRALVEGEEQLVPASALRQRWSRPEDAERVDAALAAVDPALEAVSGAPLRLDGLDLTRAFTEALRSLLLREVATEVRELAWLERMMPALRPQALVLSQEHHRTPWLLAARRAAVPSAALQHGVLYPAHPGYPGRRHPALVLPTVTFVYGDYERRVLLGMGYREDEVAVAGSPRLDLDRPAADGAALAGERRAVRTELGVGAGDRMLVVSTVPPTFVRRAHFVHMLERVLGGPLPGVHLVFKQHPGERDHGPYRELLVGLARAGGYPAPPITIVKDVDLYRLLRSADAHLGLQSTVLTDAVMAGTRNLIATVEPGTDLLGYAAAGVATPVSSPREVLAALDDAQPAAGPARDAFLADHFRGGGAGPHVVDTLRDLIARAGTAEAVR